jgi:signal transduction histidine kinase/tetratricopeptide (TPR) repeat protein
MSSRNHRKQVLLFFLAVLLPSMVLTFFTWRMIRQEKELADKRLADEHRRAARELGQLLFARLEKIKSQESAAFGVGRHYRNPEVVLIGRIDGGQLLLPWEIGRQNEEFSLHSETVSFDRDIRRAEHEEFVRGDLSQAAILYRRCAKKTRNPVQQATARLSLARSLMKLGRTTEAVEQYGNILNLPPSIADQYGVALSFYAARSLIEKGKRHADVVKLIQAELQRKEWISPAESYMLRDLVDAIADRAPEERVRSDALACRQEIIKRIKMLERALSLQKNFQGLGLTTAQDNRVDEIEPRWIGYGAGPWLLSQTPSQDAKEKLLVVVEAQTVLSSIRSMDTFSDLIPGKLKLIAGQTAEGIALGPNFRNLSVDFAGGLQNAAGGWTTRRSFYLLSLLLVLSVTSFGAYLLWRDVRREVKTAELRSQFVSSVSHELKTPLTAIRMFAETLSLGRTRNPESHKEYLDTIVNESERLTRLLNNVLDFSKIEAGRMTYRMKPTPLPDVVHAAARTMQYPLSQQGFSLNLEIAEDIPEVQADGDALEQAVLNLLNNAMKYSGDSREIDLRLAAKDGRAVIQVADRGIGIDPRRQERIFEKFYRIPSLENDRITGSGLGLALVNHIVKAHGGEVTVESTPGKGSTFSIYLPLEKIV